MTFVSLPSLTDVMSQSTGASAWAKPAFNEFLPAMFWPIGLFGAAVILLFIFSHLEQIRDWMVIRFGGPDLNKAKQAGSLDTSDSTDHNYYTGSSNRPGSLGRDKGGGSIVIQRSKINLFHNRIMH